MSDQDTDTTEDTIEGSVTDFAIVLAQHDKGRTLIEASKGLAECVEAALATNKKGGTVTVQVKVEPLASGSVRLAFTVDSKPVKTPVESIWFADGRGHLSQNNAGFFLGAN